MLFSEVIDRVRAEYLEMPGLRLTRAQAQRLCGLEGAICQAVLDVLVEEKFLVLTATGSYARATDGLPRPRPVAATLPGDTRLKTAS
jgi:hypothetical protein